MLMEGNYARRQLLKLSSVLYQNKYEKPLLAARGIT